MSRIIIISNRLPVTIEDIDGELIMHPSTGGLATGMKSLNTNGEIIWIGWPGAHYHESQQGEVREKLAKMSHHPVFIPPTIFEGFYAGFSNETIWPLFHYFQGYAKFSSKNFSDYRQVNALFSEVIRNIAKEDDTIWIQDYQLMLLPAMVRVHFPKVSMGFFLHIPFPSYEIFRTLPWRYELIRGMLGSDLIGFHTFDYVRHFQSAIFRLLNIDQPFLGKFCYKNRYVELDCFPMGIDFNHFANAVENPNVQLEIKRYSDTFKNTKIILSIDRLDYTKGLTQRIKAFSRFLALYPEHLGKVSMLIILVPSRAKISKYSELKDKIDLIVGRVNGQFGTSDWVPIHYYYRAFRFNRLIAYYHIAPIAMVTPYRDGMNLVSKEYLATKHDNTGVLILSEMAGASKELINAIIINPNNTGELIEAIKNALEMSKEEQIKRNKPMRNLLRRKTVHQWSQTFLTRLQDLHLENNQLYRKHFTPEIFSNIKKDYECSEKRLFLLDYDGSLREITKQPELAAPDESILNLLKQITDDPKNELVIITGRDYQTMKEWFGHTDYKIISDHGVWEKMSNKEGWKRNTNLSHDWVNELTDLIQQFVDRTPGSVIEEKTDSIAWHYRNVDPSLIDLRKQDFMSKTSNFLSMYDLVILEGHKVLEIKSSQINKGIATTQFLKSKNFDFIISIGDDLTDEDTFAALPSHAHTIKIGEAITCAKYHITHVQSAHRILNDLTEKDIANKVSLF